MITKKEALNLIDNLQEWYISIEPKELEKNEEGLDMFGY